MSYYQDFDPQFENSPQGPRTTVSVTVNLLLLTALVGVIVAGVFLFPSLAEQWMERKLEYRLKEREAVARSEADTVFRKKEAELAAESKGMGERLAKTEIAPSTFRTVYGKVGPAVVSIRTFLVDREGGGIAQYGEGSGVIVRVTDEKLAYVLTNSHVIHVPSLQRREEYMIADRIGITLQSGRTFYVTRGEFVYTDTQLDLAVLRFDASTMDHLVTAEFAPADAVQVGDWVMAVGSPFGLAQTVTTGIVSAKGRSTVLLDGLEMIQTDAAINPGNSGGPLLDMKGRIVGINTFIFSKSGANEGIGFAIPGDMAKDVFEQLIKPPHRLLRGYMGINALDLSSEQALKLHVKGGAVIELVQPGSPSDKAGLKQGDIVLKFKDREIKSFNELRGLIMNCKPEETVVLEVLRLKNPRFRFRERAGEKPSEEEGLLRISVKLAERPPRPEDRMMMPVPPQKHR
jgi:S1-C subfamily serine protease